MENKIFTKRGVSMVPYLYTIIDQNKLKDMFRTFYACIGLPIQIIDENGVVLESEWPSCTYCQIFKKYLPKEDSCEKIHASAGRRAIDIGETYIFSCHSNLNHIVFPLMNKDVLFGSILVGPFLMTPPDSIIIADLEKHYHIPTADLLELYDEAQNVRVIEPQMVNQISKLLYYLFSGLISESKMIFIEKQEKLYQQSRINESIQYYKTTSIHDATPTYPVDMEKDLITKVKTGNAAEAKGILNDLLGYVLFTEGGSLDVMKSRAVELCTLLSRAAIEGGGVASAILNQNTNFIRNIGNCKTSEELCYRLQEIVVSFSDNMLNKTTGKNKELIKKAVSFIAQNYANDLTLDYVAGEVHLNPAYFSTLFKKETGYSFKEYLNMIRIEESKRLLTNSNYAIVDIAIAVGFEDQSYFSKVFKKYTGITPKQYR